MPLPSGIKLVSDRWRLVGADLGLPSRAPPSGAIASMPPGGLEELECRWLSLPDGARGE